MITNWDQIKIIGLILNKDVSANAFNRDDYESEIHAQGIRLFNQKLSQVGLTKKQDKDLSPFFHKATKVAVSGTIDMTSENPAYIAYMIPNPMTARGFDEVTAGELADRLLNPITEPTLSDPIVCIGGKNLYDVYPSGILGATVGYYSYPTKPVVRWTRNETTLRPEYDTVNSIETEWDDVNKIEICYMILRDAGLNIERRDVTQVADNIIKTGK